MLLFYTIVLRSKVKTAIKKNVCKNKQTHGHLVTGMRRECLPKLIISAGKLQSTFHPKAAQISCNDMLNVEQLIMVLI